jgi:hypothetical protein
MGKLLGVFNANTVSNLRVHHWSKNDSEIDSVHVPQRYMYFHVYRRYECRQERPDRRLA